MASTINISPAHVAYRDQLSMRTLLRMMSRREENEHQSPYPQAMRNMPTRRPGNLKSNAFREPPPAYTPIAEPDLAINDISSTFAGTSLNAPQAVGTDDAYSFLQSFDTIFLIDDSGSMAGGRWREAADAISTIAPICTSHDADGIDVYFLNAPTSAAHIGITQSATVREIFDSVKPGGGTPTGQRLRSILVPYMRKYEQDPEQTKPINIICITDGDAHDDVESPLIVAAKKLDALDAPAWQVGVQFFQIGNDPEATKLLRYLDDELASNSGGSLRDIVDTVPYRGREGGTLTADGVLKVVLGSVNRRLDRRRSKDLHRSNQLPAEDDA